MSTDPPDNFQNIETPQPVKDAGVFDFDASPDDPIHPGDEVPELDSTTDDVRDERNR